VRGRLRVIGLVVVLVALPFALVPATAGAVFGPLGEDFRISFMGPNGDTSYGAELPSVAYNPSANEYLVVWAGDDILPLVEDEFEIFGQRLSASGARIDGPIRISDMGPDGNASYDAKKPSVAYNPAANDYLVVWEGDDDTAPLVGNELEIFGQRLTGAGVEQGGDFRVSEQGADGITATSATDPSVAYNSTANEYLVAWTGEDGVSDEDEIWAQRLSATGGEVGGSDFQVSDMGPPGNANFDASRAKVAANPAANEYLVVWSGDDSTNDEYEIFGQRLSNTGGPTGDNDFRISDLGPDGNSFFSAFAPSVVYNPAADQYLVTWVGDDNVAPLVVNEFEIMGQRLSATGMEAGANDFRISDMGPNGDTSYIPQTNAIAANPATGEYLVVWWGDDNTPPLVKGEFEIFGQRLTAAGLEAGANDFRVSNMGPDGDATYAARAPSVALNPAAGEYLAVWQGDDDTSPLVRNEVEIFGRRLGELPAAGGGTPDGGAPGGGEAPAAFGARTLVTLVLATKRIPARGPLKIRVANANGFEITGKLSGRTVSYASAARRRPVKLKAKAFRVGAQARKTIRLRLPKALGRLLQRKGRLRLRLTAKVKDPAGNTRTVRKTVTPRLRRR
jgi:hypothetical protein